MSNMKKAFNNVKLLSIVASVILAIAVVMGVVFGVNGWGVFNKDALLKDAKTLTVSVNTFAYQTRLDDVEEECEKVLNAYGVEYKMESEMSGDACEVVYVFNKDVDIATAVTSLETTFASDTWKDAGVEVRFAVNAEKTLNVLAEGYVWRGVIAGVVMALLVFAYVAIRHGLFKGVAVGGANLLAVLMSVAVVMITRLPITASVIYVFAMAGLFASVVAMVALKKTEESAETLAVKETAFVTVPVMVAFVLVGAIAVPGVRWFAILGLVALVVSVAVAMVFVPTFYLPFKLMEDNKPVEGEYVGAVKTSTKEKKVFVKKEVAPVEPVKEEVEEVVEETPVEETEEEEVVEETTEEAPVEEVAEETEEVLEAIPVNEEELEAPVEETVEAEEVPVAEVEEEKQD